jgi:ankyrin repeat protein
MAGAPKRYHPDFDAKAEPLNKASEQGDLRKVQSLVQAGVPVNAIGSKHTGYYPIHCAAESGHTDIVKFLLGKGAKPDVRTCAVLEQYGGTPLLLAAAKNHLETVGVLIEAGADVNAHSLTNSTALGCAILKKNREMFDYLFSRGARAEPKHFRLAVASGDTQLTQWFLDHQFKLDQEEYEVETSHLSEAISRNRLEMVRFLIEHGANVNRPGSEFAEPPLVQATSEAKWDIARHLLEKGADPNLPSKFNAYPLNYAARRNGLEIAALLMQAGANLNTVDFEQMTPLEWAVEERNEPMFSLLLKHGATVPKKLIPTIRRRFGKRALDTIKNEEQQPP